MSKKKKKIQSELRLDMQQTDRNQSCELAASG